MSKFRLPQCPYCGKKVNPLLGWYLKFQGQYHCSKCGGTSNVVLDSAVYIVAGVAVILSLVLLLICILLKKIFGLWGALLVIIPFLIFTVLSVFLVRLKKPVRKVPKGSPRPTEQSERKIGMQEQRTSQFTKIELQKNSEMRYVQQMAGQNMEHTIIRK